MEEASSTLPPDEETEEISENELEKHACEKPKKPLNMSPGAVQLRSWLNKTLRIEMTDGRILIGVFLCTDRDANVILGSCSEFLPPDAGGGPNEELRMLGLVMIPGKHIVSVHLDANEFQEVDLSTPLPSEVSDSEVT